MANDSKINEAEDPCDFNDEICIKKAFEDSYPASVKNQAVQKNIIERFLNFYLGGRTPGLHANELVFAAIAIMPLYENTEQMIWKEEHYKNDGTLFYLTADDKLKAEIKNIGAKPDSGLEDSAAEATGSENTENENKMTTNEHISAQAECKILDGENYRERGLVEPTSADADISKHTKEYEREVTDNKVPKSKASTLRVSQERTVPEILKVPENISWYSDKTKAPIRENINTQHSYGPLENSAFTHSCNELLEQWDTNANARTILKYFFGIVALTLMRATTKSYRHLTNTFASSKFRGLLDFSSGYLSYSIPHKRCIKNSYRTFRKREGNTSIMFAKIVTNLFHMDALIRAKIISRLNICKATVLAHTADYGLGMINMLQNIENIKGKGTLPILYELTYRKETSASWDGLNSFLNKYMVSTSKQKMHHWARVINGDYFKNLCCRNNYPLAVIFAVFIEKFTNNSGIWKSAWVQESAENHETYKNLGFELYDKYCNRDIHTKKIPTRVGSLNKYILEETDMLEVIDMLEEIEDREHDYDEFCMQFEADYIDLDFF